MQIETSLHIVFSVCKGDHEERTTDENHVLPRQYPSSSSYMGKTEEENCLPVLHGSLKCEF